MARNRRPRSFVDRQQARGLGQPRPEGFVKAEGDIRVLCRVGARLLQAHLIEGQLALPSHGLEGRGVITEKPQGQVIHVMTTAYRIEHVGLEHGVVGDALERDARPCQDACVVL